MVSKIGLLVKFETAKKIRKPIIVNKLTIETGAEAGEILGLFALAVSSATYVGPDIVLEFYNVK